jgi:hypothetical protein
MKNNGSNLSNDSPSHSDGMLVVIAASKEKCKLLVSEIEYGWVRASSAVYYGCGSLETTV